MLRPAQTFGCGHFLQRAMSAELFRSQAKEALVGVVVQAAPALSGLLPPKGCFCLRLKLLLTALASSGRLQASVSGSV